MLGLVDPMLPLTGSLAVGSSTHVMEACARLHDVGRYVVIGFGVAVPLHLVV